jgi:hypothetical protein
VRPAINATIEVGDDTNELLIVFSRALDKLL